MNKNLILGVLLSIMILSFTIFIDNIHNPAISSTDYMEATHFQQNENVETLLDKIQKKSKSDLYFKLNIKEPLLSDVECLAFVIYGEARSDGMLGMTAVAFTVHNRFKNYSKWHYDSYCSVIRAKGQFQFVIQPPKTQNERNSWDHAINLSNYLIVGNGFDMIESPVGKAEFFNSLEDQSDWNKRRSFITKIGSHYFYK